MSNVLHEVVVYLYRLHLKSNTKEKSYDSYDQKAILKLLLQ